MGAIFNNRAFRWTAFLAVIAALTVYWMPSRPLTCTYNYRLLIEVRTPEGLKSSSSVIQHTHVGFRRVPGSAARGLVNLTGEAVYVDLGGGKNLFVTLTNKGSGREQGNLEGALNAGDLPSKVLSLMFGPVGQEEECRAAKDALARGPVSVPLINLPTTVTFKDLNDPKSVQLVDPRNLASAFGQGYSFMAAKVEVTTDPPTAEIKQILRWLTLIPEPPLGKSKDTFHPELFGQLSNGDFISKGGMQ
jgi:hypothetical protein